MSVWKLTPQGWVRIMQCGSQEQAVEVCSWLSFMLPYVEYQVMN